MSFEAFNTRMAAVRSRFPEGGALRRLASQFDPETLYGLLQASPFEEELLRHLPQRTSEGLVSRGLRIVADGSERLMREGVELLGDERGLVVSWETRRVLRAIRYHRAKGFERERRYRFLPLLGAPLIGRRWTPSLDMISFVELLTEGGHPLAPAIDPLVYQDDPAYGERLIERYLFTDLVPLVTARHRTAAPFFADQADMANLGTLLAVSQGERHEFDPARWFIDGGGRLTGRTFREVARMKKVEGFQRLAQLFSLSYDDEEGGERVLAREVARQIRGRTARRGIEEPLGANRALWYLQEIKDRVADLRTTLIFGAAGAPAEEIAPLFHGRAA